MTPTPPPVVDQQNPDDLSLPTKRQRVPWGSCGFIEWLLCLLLPRFDIMQGDTLYLRRWLLYYTRWGHGFVHKICQDDSDRHLHDHPWDAWLVLLRRGYNEVYTRGGWRDRYVNRFRAPSIRRMQAEHQHAVKLRDGPAWTLCLCGKYRRPWGFWVDGVWQYWRDYLGIPR